VSKFELLEELNLDDMTYLKFAPITSVDVERSFSSYITLLIDNRRSFILENLIEFLIVQCNNGDANRMVYIYLPFNLFYLLNNI